MTQLYVPFIQNLQLHQIDAVVRQADGGADAQGAIVTNTATIYSNLPSTNHIEPVGVEESYGQMIMFFRGRFYLPPLADGTMPDIRRRDLIQAGTWPAGGPRVFVVDKVENVLDNSSILVVEGTTRAPT